MFFSVEIQTRSEGRRLDFAKGEVTVCLGLLGAVCCLAGLTTNTITPKRLVCYFSQHKTAPFIDLECAAVFGYCARRNKQLIIIVYSACNIFW